MRKNVFVFFVLIVESCSVFAGLSVDERRGGGRSRKSKDGTTTEEPTTTLPPICPPDKCQSPFCQCISASPPNDMSTSATPQMLLFVFHDTVTKDSLNVYRKLFPLTRRNPHGCPQAATIFVDTNNNTDYCLVAKFWERGMEIGLTGSTSNRQPLGHDFWQSASVEDLSKQITEWRQTLHKKSHIPLSDIRGWRTPFSQSGGDKQIAALKAAEFLYDTTLGYRNMGARSLIKKSSAKKLAYLHHQFYPFTFDYNPSSRSGVAECNSYPCPYGNHAGLWEVPMSLITDLEGELCPFVDNCQYQPEDEGEMLSMLKLNLYRAYKQRGNRAPVMFSFSNRWYTKEYIVKALETFLAEVSGLSDVYVVTLTDAIRWMQQPTPVSRMHKLDSWLCKNRSPVKCNSKAAIDLDIRTGRSGVVGGWDISAPNPLFGRLTRHLWLIEVVTLTIIYILLRIYDRDQE